PQTTAPLRLRLSLPLSGRTCDVRQIESKPSGVAHPACGIPIACWHRPEVPLAYLRPEPERRLSRPVILPAGICGFAPHAPAISSAGSTRDEKKPAVIMSKTYTDLQGSYGSDGTRTRDLRRDRPAF